MCNPISTIGSGISAVGGAIGDVVSAPGRLLFGQTPPSPQSQVNSVDPRLQQMQQQQAQTAIDYKNNLPAYEQQQQNSATDASRQQLAQTLAGTTAGSNARGMLYGSYNQGQQAQDTAQSESNLQQTKANINTNAQNTLSQLQNQALGTGLTINQTQQAQNNEAYQAALQQQMSNNQVFGSLVGAAGSGLGLMAGKG